MAPEAGRDATFPPAATSGPAARAWARPLLEAWGVTVPLPDVLLVISELVSNAVLHGLGGVRVRLRHRPGRLRIEVTDRGVTGLTGQVRAGTPQPDATHGRGLMIVSALASRWGVDEGARGTTVWVEMAI